MIADAHCHAWRRWPYAPRVPDPDTRGSVEALLFEMDTHGVAHAAVVCARIGGGDGGDGHENADNNDYVAAAAARHPDRLTAWVDVDCAWRTEYHTAGAADRLITALVRYDARGFTHYVEPANDGWLRTDEAAEFFAAAAARKVVASLAMGAAWFDDLSEIAAAHPALPILLHHLSHPRLGTPYNETDVAALLELAGQQNIGVKVSGFNYNARRPWDFPYPEAQQLFRRIHAAFGPRRLYWGSDFPASRDQLTYTQSIEVVRSHAADLGEADLDLILGGNLRRLLQLSPSPASAG